MPFSRDAAVHLFHPGTRIMLGDFNSAPDASRDVQKLVQGLSTWNARELSCVIFLSHLTEAWVHLHGNTFMATWSRGQSGSHLDRIYVPQTL